MSDVDMRTLLAFEAGQEDAQAEIKRLRALNSDLNRRCQQAEAAARHNVEECRRQGVSLGRYLANWTAKDYKRQLEELQAAVEAWRKADAALTRERAAYEKLEADGVCSGEELVKAYVELMRIVRREESLRAALRGALKEAE